MKTSHSWLMDEQFIMLHPALCWALDSMALAATVQALEFKLAYARNNSDTFGKFQDGRWWVYVSKTTWFKLLYFLSESTVKRSIKKLEDDGIFLTHVEVNKTVYGGQRKWFTIDYDKLNEIGEAKGPRPYAPPQMGEDEDEQGGQNEPTPQGQNEPTTGGQNEPTTKNTTKNPNGEELTAGAVTPATPAAGQPPAPQDEVKGRRSSRNTGPDKKEVDEDAGVEPDTKLAQAICSVTNSKRLTALMDRAIKGEYEIVILGKDPKTFKACPVDLYENDPLFPVYFDKLVEKFHEVLKGGRLSRQRLINAITTGENEGKYATRKHLSDYFRWKEQREAQNRANAATMSLSSREAEEAPGLMVTEADAKIAAALAEIQSQYEEEGAEANG